jgi:hypothetical protein
VAGDQTMGSGGHGARTPLQLPPLRYWLALVLLAVEVALIEKPARVTSGGVSALALPLAHWLGWRVGTLSLLLKAAILLIVLRWGGRRVALWTAVGAFFSSALIWLLEQLPWQPQWSPWLAAPVLLICADAAMALLWNAGYSTGGYAAISQVLFLRRGVPVGLSMLLLNSVGLGFVYLAFGLRSGTLSVVVSLLHGPGAALWLRVWARLLPPVGGGAGSAATRKPRAEAAALGGVGAPPAAKRGRGGRRRDSRRRARFPVAGGRGPCAAQKTEPSPDHQ